MWDLNAVPEDEAVEITPKKPNHSFSKFAFTKQAPPTLASNKIDVIKVYQQVFKDIKVENLMIKPILMPKNTLVGRIEQIYDKQAELFLKKRSFKDFDFPKTVRENMQEKFGQSTIATYQALCNLLYSANKYLDQPEVKIFNDFVLKAQDNHRLAYYLFLRQFVKAIGYVSFIAHQKSTVDPYKITLSSEICIQIVRTAFLSDDYLYSLALDKLRERIKNSKSLGYYDFIVAIYSAELDYQSLALSDILASLYTPKKHGETTQIAINFKETFNIKKQPIKSPANENQEQPHSQKINEADLEKEEVEKIAAMNTNELEFFCSVKTELQDFARFFTVTYVNHRDILHAVPNKKFEGVVQQLYKKLYYILVSIFLGNKKKFWKLMRSKSDSDSKLDDFWVQISELTNRLKKGDAPSSSAIDFINAMMKFEPLRIKMSFFLEFHLETDINELMMPDKLISLN